MGCWTGQAEHCPLACRANGYARDGGLGPGTYCKGPALIGNEHSGTPIAFISGGGRLGPLPERVRAKGFCAGSPRRTRGDARLATRMPAPRVDETLCTTRKSKI